MLYTKIIVRVVKRILFVQLILTTLLGLITPKGLDTKSDSRPHSRCIPSYIGETICKVEVRRTEHNDSTHNSEPVRHVKQHNTHEFNWRVLYTTRSFFKRKILDGLFTQQRKNSPKKLVYCFIYGGSVISVFLQTNGNSLSNTDLDTPNANSFHFLDVGF